MLTHTRVVELADVAGEAAADGLVDPVDVAGAGAGDCSELGGGAVAAALDSVTGAVLADPGAGVGAPDPEPVPVLGAADPAGAVPGWLFPG